MKMKSFKQYTTESSLGAAKQWRGANPKASTNKLTRRIRRLKSMHMRNQVREIQAGTRSFQSGNPTAAAREKRRENALRKQGELMRGRLGGFAFTQKPMSDVDVDRAVDLETDNRRAMSSNMKGKRR